MVKKKWVQMGIQLPEELAKVVKREFKGKMSIICKRAFESALNMDSELEELKQERENLKIRIDSLSIQIAEMEKSKPKKRKIWR